MNNFVNKVGHFLSPSVNNNPPGNTQEEIPWNEQCSFANVEKRRPLNGGYGVDTSLVTSFLLEILSSSSTKYPRCKHRPVAPEQVLCSNKIIATVGSGDHFDQNKEQGPDLCCKLYSDSVQNTKPGNGSDDRLCQLSTEGEPSHAESQPALTTSSKSPLLSDESSLLSEDLQALISVSLPTIARDRHWVMVYSTAKHGTSMRTLYQKCSMLSEPYLLVIGDLEGTTFGGLATAPLKPTAQRKYSGTSDSFVFTNVHKDLQLFRATGANRYYLLCTNDAICFGGGGHFALHLDDTLLTGSSGTCDTFGNKCLASTLEFSVSNVELHVKIKIQRGRRLADDLLNGLGKQSRILEYKVYHESGRQ